ncbi:MAG: hypothetical protein ACTHJ4_00165 [Candidatus Nucleicultricaceae bacterium]
MRFLWVFLVIFSHDQNAFASDLVQELCEGVHQYRIKFLKKNAGDEGTITLLGCHHYICLETLPEAQQAVLAVQAAESTRLYNERTDAYLNTKLRKYLDILGKIAVTPMLLESNFFGDYAKKISNQPGRTALHPQVSDYFMRILKCKLTPLFLELLRMPLDERSLAALQTLTIPQIVEKLPERLVYDFTASYVKRTSLEYQVIDLHRAAQGRQQDVYALDAGLELKKNEEALFMEDVNFSPLSDATVREKVLDFYDDCKWMFDESPIHSVIPKSLAQQVQVLCSVSEDMKEKINHGVLLRKIQEDQSIPNCSAMMRIGLKQSVQSYRSGDFTLGTPAENVVQRNYGWLQRTLLSVIDTPHSLIEFGDAHLLAAGHDRGILQFFIDRLLKRDEDFWCHKLGEEAWRMWECMEVQSVERLSQNGIYHFVLNKVGS